MNLSILMIQRLLNYYLAGDELRLSKGLGYNWAVITTVESEEMVKVEGV